LLRDTPVFWSRLGIGYNPPIRGNDGKWLIFNRNYDIYRRYHKQFYDIGIKVHSSVIPSGWYGVCEYDYSDVDEILDAIMDIGDDFLFLPRVKLDVPLDWCRENPEEVFVYSTGPRDADEIKNLVFTPKHDILGYEAPEGYTANNAGKLSDNRPNVGGVIGMQSFSSKKWLEDAGEALSRLVDHIASKPYADRIIGYHIAYGNCGETTAWGSWDKPVWRHGDYGISATKNFYDYSLNSYGMGYDVPSAELMYGVKNNLSEFFREGYPQCSAVSYFNSHVNINACEHFCRVIKEKDKDLVTGIFYGYIIGQANCSHGGHLAIDEAINSKYIDFIASPTGYYKDGPYGAGLEQTPCDSISRKKLWIAEIDNKTHLHHYIDPQKAKDFEETKTLLTREFTKNLAFDRGYWWMDLGEGCFDSEEIMAFLKQLNCISVDLKKEPCENISEVLIVIDDESMHYHTPSFAYHELFIKEFTTRIKMCGAPVTFIRKCDLYDMELKQFKCVFFLNCFKTDERFEAIIKNGFNKNVTFVWNYAPGYVQDSVSSENTKKLTGFDIAKYDGEGFKDKADIDFPLVYIEDSENVKPLKSYPDGKIMAGEINSHHGHKNILCTFPEFTIEDFFKIISKSGVNIISGIHTTVHQDSRFTAIFANEDTEFELNIRCGNSFYELLTGKEYKNHSVIQLKKGRCIMLKNN